MFRGHIWESPIFPAAPQEAALLKAGVPERAIYLNDIDSAIRSLRKGDKLVICGLRGIGRTEAAIVRNIERVHERGAVVMDAETGRLSTRKRELGALIKEAKAALANERRGPRKDRHKGRRPWDQIAPIWFDKLLSNKRAMAMINDGFKELSPGTIYRKLGKRNAIVGRPSAKRK